MRSFGQLLTEYMQRTGISDSEMARTLGVSRQTVFRWKEGLVARPRSREDVLRCAQRLRLTSQERDELLISAGFPPGDVTRGFEPPQTATGASPAGEDERPQTPTVSPVAADATPPTAGPAAAAQPAGGTSWELAQVAAPAAQPTELPPSGRPSVPAFPLVNRQLVALVAIALLVVAAAAALLARGILPFRPNANLPIAAPGEALVLVAQFTALAPGRPDYDVTGRVADSLAGEIPAARPGKARVVRLNEEIKDQAAADGMLRHTGATVLLWGTQTNGQIAAHLDSGDSPAAGPSPLAQLTTLPPRSRLGINGSLPQELQALASVVSARIRIQSQDWEGSRTALTQGLNGLAASRETAALLNLEMGYASQAGQLSDLDAAGRFYDQAIDLAPDAAVAYLGRGVIALRQNRAQDWQEDFERAATLEPGNPLYHRALCWGYVLDTRPAAALPECNEAVSRDETALSRDARAIALAEMGQGATSSTDFQAFLDWLKTQPPALRDLYAPTRTAWLAALKAGRNPIDQAVLDELRRQ